MTACRISKVTDKKTGRAVHLLPAPTPYDERAELLLDAVDAVRKGYYKAVMMVAIDNNGDIATDYFLPKGIGRHEMLGALDYAKSHLLYG